MAVDKDPEYWAFREEMFVRLFAEQEARQTARRESEAPVPIKLTIMDGRELDAVANVTTGTDIAKELKIQQRVFAVKFNDKVQDLSATFPESGPITFLSFDDPEGKKVFWHSSAHILGEALEKYFAGYLCIGPALEEGFYYDIALPEPEAPEAAAASSSSDAAAPKKWRSVQPEHYDDIKRIVNQVVKQKQPFQRLVLTKEQALEMFKYNKYKVEIIGSKVPDGETCTAYRCGPLIDLCKGPHIPHTGWIEAFSVTRNSSCNWLGDVRNDPLQRVTGITFPKKKMLAEWEERQRLLLERDHRRIGPEQELFMFSPLSPGSAFFLPHGTRIYTKLQAFMRSEYRKRGFSEVITPNMFHNFLFDTSGHLANYADDMFKLEVEKQDFYLKPMNCPGHCLIFKSRNRSHRELPLRLADMGALHRNEISGALTGLTRVRKFCQDDAHIFCAPDQVRDEMAGCLNFLDRVYGIFNFEFQLGLSTRPAKYLGDLEVWDKAEAALRDSLDAFGKPWKLNPGDGAFYGPKIDILLTDALGRQHQCATIQLDFQLPRRFDLEFRSDGQAKEEQYVRPVMIHRAIYGSFERFIAILIEHTGGKWPFWLSPRQIMIVPVSPKYYAQAQLVHEAFGDYYADIDLGADTFNAKIRQAQLHQYNFILVLGEREINNGTVNIRTRSEEIIGEKSIAEAVAFFKDLTDRFQ